MKPADDDTRRPDDESTNEDPAAESAEEVEADEGAEDNAVESGQEAALPADEPVDESVTGSDEEQGETAAETDPSDERDEGEDADDDELPEWEPLTPELVEEEAERGDFMLRWAVVLLAFLMGCYGIYQTTTLLRTATGQYLASHGVLPPRTDVFSLTATPDLEAGREGLAWVNLGWGTDLLLAGLYALPFHDAWFSIFAALAATLTLGLVVHISRPGLPTWWTSVVAAMALLVFFPQFVAGPESFTLLGLALTIWLLHRWSLSDQPRHLWLLVLLLFAWANLDPRAWLGLLLLVLYGAGESLGARLDRPGLLGTQRRRLYWKVTGVCAVAFLLNPFHVHTLLAPFVLYGTEYPALRLYHLLGVGQPAPIDRLQYYPLTAIVYFRGHWGNWSWLNYHVIAGLLVLSIAAVTLWLNRRRADLGHVAVLAGFTLLSLAGIRELAPAALIGAVLAGLNAQDWYTVTFRQDYTINPRELLFSRGGRAVTVLALFALAFLGITGRLTPESGRKLNLGLDPALAALVEGMTVDLNEELFTASPDLQEDLDAGQLGSTLPKLFAGNDVTLPEGVEVRTERAGLSWTIRAAEPGSDFRVLLANGRLVIYRDRGRDETHRGFNYVLEQGDVMIWIGHRPFIDSRVRLYAGSGENDLLKLHRVTRASLRLRQFRAITGEGDTRQEQRVQFQVAGETLEEIEVIRPPGGEDTRMTLSKKTFQPLKPSSRSLYPMPEEGDVRIWRATFDTYRITHVLPRLGGAASPDYRSMFALYQYPHDWQLARIGATTAVFFRKSDADASMEKFLKEHRFSFIESAFREFGDEIDPRPELARPASTYTDYLTQRRRQVVPAIERASHYAQFLRRAAAHPTYLLALQEVVVRVRNNALGGDNDSNAAIDILADTAAVAHLAIRSANEGLAIDPNNARGFAVLGIAYCRLDDIEVAFRGDQANTPNSRRRYFQALLALNQSLRIDPDNAEVLRERYRRLTRFRRVDLALDSLERYDKLTKLTPNASEQQREIRRSEVDEPLQTMIAQVGTLTRDLEKAFGADVSPQPDRLEIALEITQEEADRPVFIQAAYDLISQDPQLAANPQVRLLKTRWMMEAGIFLDEATATTLEDLFQEIGEASSQEADRTTLAISRLAFADYTQATALWTSSLAQLEQQRLGSSLRHLPLFLRPMQWPFDQINSTMNLILQLPGERSEILFNVAVNHLEAGRISLASDELARLIEEVPNSHLRPLAQFYLAQLTKKPLELVDTVPPDDMIPVGPEMFAQEPGPTPQPTPKKP